MRIPRFIRTRWRNRKPWKLGERAIRRPVHRSRLSSAIGNKKKKTRATRGRRPLGIALRGCRDSNPGRLNQPLLRRVVLTGYTRRALAAIGNKSSSLPLRASSYGGDDRVSALVDDLLLLILRRLDTRSALATAALSKRWASIPRGLHALSFRVNDILPPRYHQCIRIHREANSNPYGYSANFRALGDKIRRYERRAMRSMSISINNLLDADDYHDARSVSTLRVEFFATWSSSGCINRLIAKAVDTWGVEDLEVSAKPVFFRQYCHSFHHHSLCNDPHKSRLRSLKLSACHLPLLMDFRTLTSLVLQGLPDSTPTAAYVSVFTLCPQLQAVHIKSCNIKQGDMAVHAPRSEIKQLIIEHCYFGRFKLYTLPMLESMAVIDTSVSYNLSSFPCLKHLNITRCYGVFKTRPVPCIPFRDLNMFLGGSPGITDLVVCFTGYDRWLKACSSALLLPKLRRLLIADVPSSWDISWPRLLIESAPCLENLHIHISPCEEDPCDDIVWKSPKFCHNQLKEFVITGFEGTERQMYFVSFVMEVATKLQSVSLLKNGLVQRRGHWDWDMVKQQHQWANEERIKILEQIAKDVPCSTTPVQVVLE